MKINFTQKRLSLIFAATLFLIVSVSAVGQTVITKTIPDDGADIATVIKATAADAATLNGDTIIVNVPAGVLSEPNAFITNGQFSDKQLVVYVKGAGAGSTILQGPAGAKPLDNIDVSRRMWTFNDNTIRGMKITFMDLTFKWWGHNNNANGANGGIFNFTPALTSPVEIKFENVIFEENLGRSLFVTYRSSYSFIFDNCIFINNILLKSTNGTAMNALIFKGQTPGADGGGVLEVRNTTFIGNEFRTSNGSAMGSCILVQPDASQSTNLVIEGCAFVANSFDESSPLDSDQGIVGVNAVGTFDLTMNNNIFLGNIREGSQDKDVLINNTLNSISSAGNIATVVKSPNTDLSENGFLIDETYTYDDERILMETEDGKPKLTLDAFGIGHVVYSGDGSTSTLDYVADSELLNIYSAGKDVVVEGLNGSREIAVYDLSGKLIHKSLAGSTYFRLTLNSGIYIVKIDRITKKVFVF